MYAISHMKKDGSFVNLEAKQKSDDLDMHCEELDMTDEEAYTAVFGKEHPGCVRGMGMGVCPSQIFGTSYRGSTMPTPSNSTVEELKALEEASNAKIKALEEATQASNARYSALEERVTFLMHNLGSQVADEFPHPRVNEVGDLESPAEPRRSSNDSHEPQNGPSFSA